MTDEAMIPVRLARVVLREDTPQQWVHLQEQEGERGFPIVIGMVEASEIRRVLHDDSTPRPLTHQLTHGILAALDAKLVGVDIIDLRDNTFYAELLLERPDGETARVDARPSDALALGLRAGCPLRVAESVLQQVRVDQSGADPDPLPPE